MKKRLLVCAGALIVLLTVAPLVPTGGYIVIGLWRGEHFYRGRPTSYWRGVLLEDPQAHAWPLSVVRDLTDQGARLLGISGRTASAPGVINVNNFPQFVASFPGECPRLAVFGRSPDAVGVLVDLLVDNDVDVRRFACQALGQANARPQAVTALAQALEDGDAFVRWTAAWALGNYGANAQSAVPALVRRVRDRPREERLFSDFGSPSDLATDDFFGVPAWWAAAETLKRLDPEAARRAGVQ